MGSLVCKCGPWFCGCTDLDWTHMTVDEYLQALRRRKVPDDGWVTDRCALIARRHDLAIAAVEAGLWQLNLSVFRALVFRQPSRWVPWFFAHLPADSALHAHWLCLMHLLGCLRSEERVVAPLARLFPPEYQLQYLLTFRQRRRTARFCPECTAFWRYSRRAEIFATRDFTVRTAVELGARVPRPAAYLQSLYHVGDRAEAWLAVVEQRVFPFAVYRQADTASLHLTFSADCWSCVLWHYRAEVDWCVSDLVDLVASGEDVSVRVLRHLVDHRSALPPELWQAFEAPHCVLHHAATLDHLAKVQLLYQLYPAGVGVVDTRGLTPAQCARTRSTVGVFLLAKEAVYEQRPAENPHGEGQPDG